MGGNFFRGTTRAASWVVAIVGMLILAGVSTAWADPPDAREVTLKLSFDGAGKCSISVDPEIATIWRGQHQKIKKVYWVAAPNSQYPELYWELRYDPGKGGGTGDYFGAVNLSCGVNEIKVKPQQKPAKAKAEWPYSVSVFSCSDGARSEHLCTVDPRIRWDD
jgi:hypothetical protein